jgi:hypothetical protein
LTSSEPPGLLLRNACISEPPYLDETLGSPDDAIVTIGLNETLATMA